MPDAVRLLDPQGERVPHPDYGMDLPVTDLRELYRDMVLVRRIDSEATALQRTGELGLWCPTLGQEAIQVAAGHALRPQDYAFTSYREVGVFRTRGVDPLELLQLYRGNTHGGWDPHEKGLALFTIVIGSHALHAVGYAMGVQRDGADTAVLAAFGDGATSTGDVHEAMVFAASFSCPVVFLVQNNHWAISTPVERQARVPIVTRAAGYGMPGVRVDGDDVLASLAVMRAALDRAREGGGPTLVEAVTYRMGAHTTSDDPTRYRTQADMEPWQARDPIDRLRRYLERLGGWDEKWAGEVQAEADDTGERMRAAIRGAVDPDPLLMFDHVYAEPHREVDADRGRAAAWLAGE